MVQKHRVHTKGQCVDETPGDHHISSLLLRTRVTEQVEAPCRRDAVAMLQRYMICRTR